MRTFQLRDTQIHQMSANSTRVHDLAHRFAQGLDIGAASRRGPKAGLYLCDNLFRRLGGRALVKMRIQEKERYPTRVFAETIHAPSLNPYTAA